MHLRSVLKIAMTTRRIELQCATLQSIDLTKNEEKYSAILAQKQCQNLSVRRL